MTKNKEEIDAEADKLVRDVLADVFELVGELIGGCIGRPTISVYIASLVVAKYSKEKLKNNFPSDKSKALLDIMERYISDAYEDFEKMMQEKEKSNANASA